MFLENANKIHATQEDINVIKIKEKCSIKITGWIQSMVVLPTFLWIKMLKWKPSTKGYHPSTISSPKYNNSPYFFFFHERWRERMRVNISAGFWSKNPCGSVYRKKVLFLVAHQRFKSLGNLE